MSLGLVTEIRVLSLSAQHCYTVGAAGFGQCCLVEMTDASRQRDAEGLL